jgi:hypothetical protein
MDIERFVLYVGKCSNSMTALRYSSATKIRIVELDVEKIVDLPKCIVGTPTLIDLEFERIYSGSECLKVLQSFCFYSS